MKYWLTPLMIALLGSILIAQQKPTTDVPVNGHVYEPAKLPATDELIDQLRLPPGFSIQKFAEIANPRMLVVGADGTVYVSQREPGTVTMLKDLDNDGVADVQKVVAEKPMLHGLAIHQNKMYLAAVTEVYVADIQSDGALGPLKTIISGLPDGGQHPNRTLAVGPDNLLYISIGSTCNACNETNPQNATIVRGSLDGRNLKIFASGLRNTIGYGWHPVTKQMFGLDHGIDWLGDNEQGEELNELVEGAKYGWPYVFGNDEINPHGEPPPTLGLTKEDWARQSKQPILLYTPHSAPMQMVFYTGAMFPAEFRNDAFAAMRGSWNRVPPSGYEVVRIRFDNSGRPKTIEPFLTGFLVKGRAPQGKDGQFARLAGIAVGRDGALLVTDDNSNNIYRVSYGPAKRGTMKGRQMITSLLPENKSVPANIRIRSTDFVENGPIADEHSAYFQNSSPQLSWSGIPAGARSIVLMMEDPDAASPKPVFHWIVANIPASVTSLAASFPKTERVANFAGLIQGSNFNGTIGYYGPRPPPDDPPHHYHFQIFALDTMLELPSGFNRQALLNAMQGHVIARGDLVGTYQRRSGS